MLKKKVIQKLRAKIKRHEQDIQDCRGSGICASDHEAMRMYRGRIQGLQTAIRLIQRTK